MSKITERVTGHTELIGLIAKPIRHSKSPTMHNESFAKLGLDYCYMVFEVDNDTLEDTVKGFRAMQVRGWNVSMPNKTAICQYLDVLTPAAKMCNAVNTVVNDHGVLTGTITDGIGFMCALKESGIDVIGKKITICGAGGAATAICMQAALDGVKEISVFNRRDEFYERGIHNVDVINSQTKCKAKFFDLADRDALKKEVEESYLFVNATSTGMKPQEDIMIIPDETYLRKDLFVADVVYAPKETKLLKVARKVGCKKAINGEGMMLYQGAAAFEIWTGKEMPIEHVKDVLDIEL